MANAVPLSKQDKAEKAEQSKGPEIVGKLPEGFEVPANAKKVIVDERGTVRVDLGD